MSHAMICNASLYFALIHFFHAASSAVSTNENSIIKPPHTINHKNHFASKY
jgi:hypothetical protein